MTPIYSDLVLGIVLFEKLLKTNYYIDLDNSGFNDIILENMNPNFLGRFNNLFLIIFQAKRVSHLSASK